MFYQSCADYCNIGFIRILQDATRQTFQQFKQPTLEPVLSYTSYPMPKSNPQIQ